MPGKKLIKVPTTGVFDFETLVTDEEAKYVDKTDLLYELARHKSDAQLFISRPRRFGKSLMLSTLKAMFEGRRDLFKGLAIDKLPWEGWETPTPVYSFTMGDMSGENYAEVKEQLGELVDGLFEVMSACATVGLTRGATTTLNLAGKLIVTLAMYLGRIGPISMAIFLARGKGTKEPEMQYADGNFYIG